MVTYAFTSTWRYFYVTALQLRHCGTVTGLGNTTPNFIYYSDMWRIFFACVVRIREELLQVGLKYYLLVIDIALLPTRRSGSHYPHSVLERHIQAPTASHLSTCIRITTGIIKTKTFDSFHERFFVIEEQPHSSLNSHQNYCWRNTLATGRQMFGYQQNKRSRNEQIE